MGGTTLLYLQQTPMLERGEDFSECFGRVSNFITVLTGVLITHAGVPEILADIVLLTITGITGATFARALGPKRFLAAVLNELRRRTALKNSNLTNLTSLADSLADKGTAAYQQAMEEMQYDTATTREEHKQAQKKAQARALAAVRDDLLSTTDELPALEAERTEKEDEVETIEKQLKELKEGAKQEEEEEEGGKEEEIQTIKKTLETAKAELKSIKKQVAVKEKEQKDKNKTKVLRHIDVVLEEGENPSLKSDSDAKIGLKKLKKYATTNDGDGWTFNVYNDPLSEWDPMRFKMLSPSQKLHLMEYHPVEVADVGRFWGGTIEIFGKPIVLAAQSKGAKYGSPESGFEPINLIGSGEDIGIANAFKAFKKESARWKDHVPPTKWPMRICGLTDDTKV